MTRKRGVGQKKKKKPDGRTQGCRSGKAGGWPSTCPPYCRIQVGGPLGTPGGGGGGEEREKGLAGSDRWGEAFYLGSAHVLPGPLELQPEVGGVRAALESVQLDPEDALHLQPLPLHPGLRLGLHHEPFLRRRVAPGQEHGWPARPRKEGADSATGVPRPKAPKPRPLLPAARPRLGPGPPGSRTHPPRLGRPSSRAPSLSAAAPATIFSCQRLQPGVGPVGLPSLRPQPSPLHHCASPSRMNFS